MPAPAKYLFNDDFARPGDGRPSIALAEHALKVKEAENAAFARGFAAATAEAKSSSEAHASAAAQARKFLRSAGPTSVMYDSGWNWTPSRAAAVPAKPRCRTPMITPSSEEAAS